MIQVQFRCYGCIQKHTSSSHMSPMALKIRPDNMLSGGLQRCVINTISHEFVIKYTKWVVKCFKNTCCKQIFQQLHLGFFFYWWSFTITTLCSCHLSSNFYFCPSQAISLSITSPSFSFYFIQSTKKHQTHCMYVCIHTYLPTYIHIYTQGCTIY